jgi:integrase
MAREVDKLTVLAIKAITNRGLYHDGNNLYLRVGPTGAKSWVVRYRGADGKQHDVGLGSTYAVTLERARVKCQQIHADRADGIDPIAAKKAAKAEQRAAAARDRTFKQVAEEYIEAHKTDWKTDAEAKIWRQRLRDHVHPVIGDLPVAMIGLALVLKVVGPKWLTLTSMDKILRYIETILTFATVKGYRTGDNPARAKDVVIALGSRARVAKANHPALHYRDIGDFVAKLRAIDKIGAKALLFTILTAARRDEVNGAVWSEIDLKGREWVIPGPRMKAEKDHVVPLSEAAVALLEALPRTGDRVFSMGVNEIRRTCVKLNPNITTHGFRSTFRDWAGDCTKFDRVDVELCLAHAAGDAVELAYRRSTAVEKRRLIMESWAKFCGTPSLPEASNIYSLRLASA